MTAPETPCCPIGARSDVAEIDAALRRVGEEGAEGLRAIGRRIGVAHSGLSRHRTRCLGLGGAAQDQAGPPEDLGPNHPQERGIEAGDAENQIGERAPAVKPGGPRAAARSPFAVPNPGDDPDTAPRKLVGAQLEDAALDLRASGMTLVKIGEELGIDRETARELINTGLDRLRRGSDAKAERVRSLEVRQIELLLAKLWSRATDPKASGEPITGDDGEILGYGYSPAQDKAVERITKLLERRAKLLGLDAPTKHEVDIRQRTEVVEFVDFTIAVLKRHPAALAEWLAGAKLLPDGTERVEVRALPAPKVITVEPEKEETS